MINVTVTYTDNLGPEADIAGLLRKIAVRLEADFGSEPMVGVCIGAMRLTDFVVADGRADRASVTLRATLPEDRLEDLRARLLDDLSTLVEGHLVDLYGGHSLTTAIELTPIAPQNVVGRITLGPAGGRRF
jgi:5-carboxymethyl-2-hydroxymuconate isomerase